MLVSDNISQIHSILSSLDIDLSDANIKAKLIGDDPIVNSVHKVGEAGAITQLLMDILAGKIWQTKVGNKEINLSITIEDALHSIHETHYITQGGYHIDVGAERVAVNNVFECSDGRYVMLEAGPPYDHLLYGYLNFFHCPNTYEAIKEKVATYDSETLEKELNALGLPCSRAFTTEEWLQSPQGQLLAQKPIIEITKLSSGEPVPFDQTNQAPLSGINVFDFTHVLAGPYSTRSLGLYGANVLHISSPYHPDTLSQHLGVDIGKKNAYLDLNSEKALSIKDKLIEDADVIVSSYRKNVNEKFGIFPDIVNSSKGKVLVELNAYGSEGAWSERGGFDQNGQVVSGFSMTEGDGKIPKFSPVFYLNDLLTGHLATIGALAALIRRSIEGGSYSVKVNLTKTAMWVESLGLIDKELLGDLPATDVYELTNIEHHMTDFGELTYPGSFVKGAEAYKVDNNFLTPYGSSEATW